MEWYRHYKLRPPRGILICGPPGSGKTHLAIASIRKSGINAIAVDGAQLRSKYIGESEANLKRLFDRARQCAPCALFIDQVFSYICICALIHCRILD